jgi:hypothetical protein
VWLVIGMALFRNRSIQDIVNQLDLALPGVSLAVAPSSVVEARARLGAEPMEWRFGISADYGAHASARDHRWRGLALYGVDGTTLRVPDSKDNASHFGDSHSVRGESAYPMVRVVGLPPTRSRGCITSAGSWSSATTRSRPSSSAANRPSAAGPPGGCAGTLGVFLAHNLVRLEMERVAADAGVEPTRISFVAALRLICDEWPWCAVAAPGAIPRHLRNLRASLAILITPPGRSNRSYPRAVQIKMSNDARKRRSSPSWSKGSK